MHKEEVQHSLAAALCLVNKREKEKREGDNMTDNNKKRISRNRVMAAYIIAFIIPGIGHIVVGRVVRGILIFIAGWFVGFFSALVGGLIFAIIFGIAYWAFQLIDLRRQIHQRMEVVR